VRGEGGRAVWVSFHEEKLWNRLYEQLKKPKVIPANPTPKRRATRKGPGVRKVHSETILDLKKLVKGKKMAMCRVRGEDIEILWGGGRDMTREKFSDGKDSRSENMKKTSTSGRRKGIDCLCRLKSQRRRGDE